MEKWIYDFSEGSKEQAAILGGKGANLAEMTTIGLPVPSGFTISTKGCLAYLKTKTLSDGLLKELRQQLLHLEEKTQKQFGGSMNPLLVSVRSGAKYSMPGMMDTILNLGLNDQSVAVLADLTKTGAFAYDCYRRLIQMYADVVKGVPKNHFENYLAHYKALNNYATDSDLSESDWQQVAQTFKQIYQEHTQETFPQDPYQQLESAIVAVFRSWNNPRAKVYRKIHGISDDLGTAVNIQEMVFGNIGENSGTGVAFTRNPATGEKGVFGEYLLNAQGEDVVAGIRTPNPISQLAFEQPEIYQEFKEICRKLEAHYKDMQDIEFTIESGRLFILQTRNGKRTAKAAFQIVIDLVDQGLITKKEGLSRLTTSMITQLLHPIFEEKARSQAVVVAKGLPASPGAATGKVYFTAEAAKAASQTGEKVILLRQETSPEDIEGMLVSEAIVTSRGGMTSHAAVVARGMGVCCVAGCESLRVDEFLKQASTAEMTIQEGDFISVDGVRGLIYAGTVTVEGVRDLSLLKTTLSWAQEIADIKVRANAETIPDIQTALTFGAAGIGLARTEHMFFGEERIMEMRKMILADDLAERKIALAKLKRFQVEDFKKILALTGEKKCTIRLLDPPLHEFLPKKEEYAQVAKECGKPETALADRVSELAEVNPMLGHRGCRLGITYPEIYEMQTEAIIEAALELAVAGKAVHPEIMIPLVSEPQEMTYLKDRLQRVICQKFNEYNKEIPYKIGAMLEIPRACFVADELAETADFFSFGTNDLTQLTYGFSRDDAMKFIPQYLEAGILEEDPYQELDTKGVGQLMKIAIDKVRPKKPEISFGVCGEVGGNPNAMSFLREIGVDYISCSPYRVPAALLMLAQTTNRTVSKNKQDYQTV